MKPFSFTLEPVRSLRRHKEQAAQEHYAKAVRACEAAAARVQATSTELSACWTTLCEQLAAGVAGADLLRTRAWCNVLELRLKERTAALEQARLAVDAAMRELMLAAREREALDRLHDNRQRTYNLEQQRDEQKTLDEIALQLAHSSAPLRFAYSATASAL
ncbi:MAG TPA: flagellar export protein FliJ [Bacillota bacterium]|nr:flagellar export protein FliJ [Bacillota bacterium]